MWNHRIVGDHVRRRVRQSLQLRPTTLRNVVDRVPGDTSDPTVPYVLDPVERTAMLSHLPDTQTVTAAQARTFLARLRRTAEDSYRTSTYVFDLNSDDDDDDDDDRPRRSTSGGKRGGRSKRRSNKRG